MIWTRVDPAADAGPGVEVTWEVAADDAFATVLQAGTVTAGAATDHTLHVTLTGLAPDSWFRYRFTYGTGAAARTSRTGRLRTAPAPGSSPDQLRFAFCSCQQINPSFYVAHAAMAAEDLDYVVHYGDYVYVSDGGTLTLDDYRAVYRRFKENPYLQELHATYPMVVMWDDGEFVNNIDRHLDPARFAAAKQAWFEFQPVDRNPDEADRTYRELEWGTLVDFLLLDVRQYRDTYVPPNDDSGLLSVTDTALPSGAVIFDEDRTCLGLDQKAWLKERLLASGHTWRHIGHGYPFVTLRLGDYDTPAARADPPAGFHVNGGKYLSTEQWDGYWAERKELMAFLADECVENVVASSGQTHIYFGAGIQPDYDDLEGSPTVMWEFTCGSLTADPDPRSSYFPDLPRDEAEASIHSLEKAFLGANPQVDFIDLLNQGYGIITFTAGEARVDFRVIDTFDEDAVATTSKTYRIPVGSLPSGAGVCGADVPPTTTPTTAPPTEPGAVAPASGARPVAGDPSYTG
ncbi:alkaline phosphatase D family protein [Aquihabitans sp. G128]|uniref:alkaline phosphatase D family protein n=1 Tax=Aquihabitans sp. G128 TaxID=2849779 RepID=UPI001C22EFB3|nr:alkaline phosphatase D family protein [Aquihabitans sp. G128]